MSTTCRIAVLQMTSTSDKLRNRSKCQSLLQKAKSYGAQAAFLPEAFDFIGEGFRFGLVRGKVRGGYIVHMTLQCFSFCCRTFHFQM